MNRLILSILVSAVFNVFHSPCTAQYLKVQDSKDKRIIDLDKATYPDTAFLHSTQFKSVKIIPLETNKSCLLAYISKIQVIDSFILVLDKTLARSLYVFDREGRFIRKIGTFGQGPGDYVQINDFTIDRDSKTVYIKDGFRLHKYDLATGRFIQTIVFSRNTGKADFAYFECVGGHLYACALFSSHSDNNYLLFTIDEETGYEKNNFLNVMEYNKGLSNTYSYSVSYFPFFSRGNSDVIFFQLFMNHIVEIKEDGVFSLFELKGKNLLTYQEAKRFQELFSTENMEQDKVKQRLDERMQSKKYSDIKNYVESGEMVRMDLEMGINVHKLVINKKTNEVSIYKGAYDDVLYSKRDRTIFYPLGCCDSKGAYHIMSSINQFKKFYNEGWLSPDVIGLEKINELVEDDNPILLYYEF